MARSVNMLSDVTFTTYNTSLSHVSETCFLRLMGAYFKTGRRFGRLYIPDCISL